MARALRTAAFVVGAVALAATGVGALGSAGLISLGTAAGAISSIATIATIAAGALSIAASAAGKPPPATFGGNPTKFKIDRDSGIPIAIGRMFPAGWTLWCGGAP